jgi:hypothetical protein
VLLGQTAPAWFMTGFISVMQVLHYPLFAKVGLEQFPGYEAEHNRRFGCLVGPGVLAALVTSVWLMIGRPSGVAAWMPIVTTGLLVVIIGSTARYQAPAHGRLRNAFDPAILNALLRGNWTRTIAWTLIGLLDLWMLHGAH